MTHIAYYVPATLYRHQGIRRRVAMTLAAWARCQVSAELVTGEDGTTASGPALWQHYRADRAAARYLAELTRAGRIEAVHARLFLPGRQWLSLAGEVPVFLEIHAGLRQAESPRDRVRVVAGWRSSRALVSAAAGGAFVTTELAGLPEFRSLSPTVVLGNGIELTEPAAAPDNPNPVFGMAAGSVSPWHGLDRFAELAERIPRVEFRVAHPIDVPLPPLPRVRLRPMPDAAAFAAELRTWDAAAGSLAMERAGLTEAAPLKVRDYVAAGIPVLLNYRDTNLDAAVGHDPAVLRIASDPAHWDAATIATWLAAARGRRLAAGTRQLVNIEQVEHARLTALRSGRRGGPSHQVP